MIVEHIDQKDTDWLEARDDLGHDLETINPPQVMVWWSRSFKDSRCPLCRLGICVQRVDLGEPFARILHGRIPQ